MFNSLRLPFIQVGIDPPVKKPITSLVNELQLKSTSEQLYNVYTTSRITSTYQEDGTGGILG